MDVVVADVVFRRVVLRADILELDRSHQPRATTTYPANETRSRGGRRRSRRQSRRGLVAVPVVVPVLVLFVLFVILGIVRERVLVENFVPSPPGGIAHLHRDVSRGVRVPERVSEDWRTAPESSTREKPRISPRARRLGVPRQRGVQRGVEHHHPERPRGRERVRPSGAARGDVSSDVSGGEVGERERISTGFRLHGDVHRRRERDGREQRRRGQRRA